LRAAEEANVNKREESNRPGLHVLAKPIGPECNITCDYCLYREKHDPGVAVTRGQRAWRQGVWALLVVTVLAVVCGAADAGQPTAAEQPDPQRLAGRWVRLDGGYVLEIREAGVAGTLKAAYFNPRPINVAKAEWRVKGGALTVFIELRDVNYPGSTYTLQYDPGSDRLKGLYFQAVEKQTFAVEFMRRP
jgi:hypothetical protein